MITNSFGVVTGGQSSLLNHSPQFSIDKFLLAYSRFQDIDLTESKSIINKALQSHRSTKIKSFPKPKCLQSIEDEWYRSLRNDGEPYYEMYNHDDYFHALWACWITYSRAYLLSMIKDGMLPNGESIYTLFRDARSVADLGCGLGYTTASLKELFPNSYVVGTNLKQTRQYDFCKFMSDSYDFDIKDNAKAINRKIDLVFASEYFEHIVNATEHLEEVLTVLQPRFLYVANSFNTRSAGHFKTYKLANGDDVPAKEMTKRFNAVMKSHGYRKLKTKVWNNKPSVWVGAEG